MTQIKRATLMLSDIIKFYGCSDQYDYSKLIANLELGGKDAKVANQIFTLLGAPADGQGLLYMQPIALLLIDVFLSKYKSISASGIKKTIGADT